MSFALFVVKSFQSFQFFLSIGFFCHFFAKNRSFFPWSVFIFLNSVLFLVRGCMSQADARVEARPRRVMAGQGIVGLGFLPSGFLAEFHSLRGFLGPLFFLNSASSAQPVCGHFVPRDIAGVTV
jgi:hypothetical protein